MTRFIHLTDLHVSDPQIDDPQLVSDTSRTLAAVVERIRALDPAPDLVALSGDLTNQGDPASYRRLRALLAPLDLPLVFALGNHDTREGFRAVFGDPGGAAPGAGSAAPLFHHRVAGGLHAIALDSSIPGRVGGGIDAAQLSQLRRALSARPDLPKLILCHHPPAVGADRLAWECLNPVDSARLADALKGHNVAAVLSGHVHLNRVLHWHGIPVIVSNGLHNTVDPLEPEDMVLEEGSGFALGEVTGGVLDLTFVPVAPGRARLGRIPVDRLRTFS